MEAKGRITCTIMAVFFSLTICLIDIVKDTSEKRIQDHLHHACNSIWHPRQVRWNKELLQDDTETHFISVPFLHVLC